MHGSSWPDPKSTLLERREPEDDVVPTARLHSQLIRRADIGH
jgi:hypothetical protein